MKVNYITNLPPNEISGGFSGMNAIACKALSEKHEINYVGPVNPPVFKSQALWSRFQKALGWKRFFFLFSEKRLARVAHEVEANCDPTADFDFYHGFTPWIRCKTTRPYLAWSDCAFLDYLEIFHKGRSYQADDVQRIAEGERNWFNHSKVVFLSSQWAKRRLENTYKLAPDKVGSFGIFGGMEPPANDNWNGSRDFYFISTDYRLKNGGLCRKAMEEVWKRHPEVRLRIVGAKPPPEDLVPGRVTYEGYFKKSEPAQLNIFREHLANAFAILHPTDADTTAMILIEAAFFGCPSISVNDFALQEVLGANDSGILLERPITPANLAEAMLMFLDHPEKYQVFRRTARARALEHHSIPAFCARVQNAIDAAFEN